MIKIQTETRAQADRIKVRLDRDPDIKSIVFKDRVKGCWAIGSEASPEVYRSLVPLTMRAGAVCSRLARS